LEVFSVSRFQEDFQTCQQFRKEAELLSQRADLDQEDYLNLKLFLAELDTFLDGYECKGFLFPINYMEGVQIKFQRLADWVCNSFNYIYV